MRLAHELQCLRTNSYGFAAQALQGIGAMVGGWPRLSSFPNLLRAARRVW